MQVVTAHAHQDWIELHWSNGSTSHHLTSLLHYGNQEDVKVFDSQTHQRKIELQSLPADVRVQAVTVDQANQCLCIQWRGQQHDVADTTTVIAIDSLRPMQWPSSGGCHAPPLPKRILWSGTVRDMSFDYQTVHTDPTQQRQLLTQFLQFGFARLHGVPTESAQVLELAQVFGPVRETNYGRHFDVVCQQQPVHMANTRLGLAMHTDNNYRFDTPNVQLLHCLTNSVGGGESLLVDGFHIAHLMRERYPSEFLFLAMKAVPFEYQDQDTHLYAERPTIVLDVTKTTEAGGDDGGEGEVRSIHLNERTMQLPRFLDLEEQRQFAHGLRLFTQLAYDSKHALRFRMEPGDAVIFDNLRLLHGRTAYTSEGDRHLQGCYSDVDSYTSRYRVLTDLTRSDLG